MKNYIMSAEFSIIEMNEEEAPTHPGESLEKIATAAVRTLTGGMMVAPMMVQPNRFTMSKAVQISGAGIDTVAAVMKQLNEALERIAIETV